VSAGVELEVLGSADPGTGTPTNQLEFVADRGALERIMANLISNALAAAPGGHVWLSAAAGPPIVIGSSSGATSETVTLAVTDDGPGFPPGATARAFERFYRADPARAGSGSGLGLAIVREFAAAHGGTAHAENVAPRGARVSVVLPRIPPAR
jgi:signal transduction histidine kinase